VKVHHNEGLANHIVPKPCVAAREGVGEASAGVRAGQSTSREITESSGCRRPGDGRKATRTGALSQAPVRSGVVVETGMCGSSVPGNRDISWLAGGRIPHPVRIGKARSRTR
jgi:hypothetical protein